MLFLIFLWALWGAVEDFRYLRNGGIKPTNREWLFLAIAVAASIAGVLVLWSKGAPLYGVRDMASALGMILVILWEFGRWRVRFRSAT
jgi:hypothetical protein